MTNDNDASSRNPDKPVPPPQPSGLVLHLGQLVAPESADSPGTDESLTGFIAKAAADAVVNGAKPVIVPRDAGTIPPQGMLGVVSYCYTKGVYGSEEIGRELVSDPMVREVARGDVPRPEDIRRFRRLNRAAIQATVEKALAFARHKVREAWSPENPFEKSARNAAPSEVPPPADGAENTTRFVRRDAAERIDKATFIDGMSM